MKSLLSVLALYLLLFSTCIFAQEADSLNWFPYKTGDMWEYTVYHAPGVTDTAQILNVKDSVSTDGKILLTQYQRFINPVMDEYFLPYAIDTATAEVFQLFATDPPRSTSVPIYKFNAQRGAQWVVYAHEGGGYEMARIMEAYDGTLFGKSTRFIQIQYYLAADSADTVGLSREWVTLARGFGLIESFPSEGGYWYVLKGAVINGIQYGDTTRIITPVQEDSRNTSPKHFELHQNYPNPFNQLTIISFNLNASGSFSLVVYDALGREIRRLIDNQRLATGIHTIIWDGRTVSTQEAPTGVYYYRLLGYNSIITRSMILLK